MVADDATTMYLVVGWIGSIAMLAIGFLIGHLYYSAPDGESPNTEPSQQEVSEP